MRTAPRLLLIYVLSANNAANTVDRVQPASPNSTPNTTGVSRLAIQSPFTPGPTTAVYYREAATYIPESTTAIYRGRAFSAPKHVPTAWQGRFSFFSHFPPEIRERVYRHLIGDIIVEVNAISSRTVRVSKRKLLEAGQEPSVCITLPYRPVSRLNNNWLCVSRQFFFESRKLIWRSMSVKFARRWDFINASLKGTLIADAPRTAPTGMDAPILFPLKTDVMSHIRELNLNLTTGTDFTGRVTRAEASRVTTSMLEVIDRDMPLLKTLLLIVDDRSRLSDSVIAFLPDAWFLEALLAIKHVRMVSFASGPGWQGHAQNKKNARSCLYAMNAVLGAHFIAHHPTSKLDSDGITGRKLQARLGRRMLYYFRAFPQFHDAQNALAMKVVMLESHD